MGMHSRYPGNEFSLGTVALSRVRGFGNPFDIADLVSQFWKAACRLFVVDGGVHSKLKRVTSVRAMEILLFQQLLQFYPPATSAKVQSGTRLKKTGGALRKPRRPGGWERFLSAMDAYSGVEAVRIFLARFEAMFVLPPSVVFASGVIRQGWSLAINAGPAFQLSRGGPLGGRAMEGFAALAAGFSRDCRSAAWEAKAVLASFLTQFFGGGHGNPLSNKSWIIPSSFVFSKG